VAIHDSYWARHVAPFQDLPPTGKEATSSGSTPTSRHSCCGSGSLFRRWIAVESNEGRVALLGPTRNSPFRLAPELAAEAGARSSNSSSAASYYRDGETTGFEAITQLVAVDFA
jgi:hypothetical protein